MDVFLIIITIIFSILLLVVSFYILALYCHPDDRGFGSHILLKVLVIVGLTLSWAQVLMVPLDVANSRGEGGDLDMMSFWNTIYCIIAFMVTILLPFAIFMYETDEDKSLVTFLILGQPHLHGADPTVHRSGHQLHHPLRVLELLQVRRNPSVSLLQKCKPVPNVILGHILQSAHRTDFHFNDPADHHQFHHLPHGYYVLFRLVPLLHFLRSGTISHNSREL